MRIALSPEIIRGLASHRMARSITPDGYFARRWNLPLENPLTLVTEMINRLRNHPITDFTNPNYRRLFAIAVLTGSAIGLPVGVYIGSDSNYFEQPTFEQPERTSIYNTRKVTPLDYYPQPYRNEKGELVLQSEAYPIQTLRDQARGISP